MTKLVTIATNDPKNPTIEVPLHATVLHGKDIAAGASFSAVLFRMPACAECHATPAGKLTGVELYAAVCEMCHGPLGTWAQSLPASRRSRAVLWDWTANGRKGTSMPGYLASKGGPLTKAQVDSLVEAAIDAQK